MNPIRDYSETEIVAHLHEQQMDGRRAIFIYTPMCGTCQATERMLQVVQASDRAIPIVKLNINFAPTLREQWRVESVPCLITIAQDGTVLDKRYALEGAGALFELLRRE